MNTQKNLRGDIESTLKQRCLSDINSLSDRQINPAIGTTDYLSEGP